jgi:hypothetical protein
MEELARDVSRGITPAEARTLSHARTALEAADAVVIHFGGRAGRLGEAIVGTVFLEGTLRTLAAIGKQHTPVEVIVDVSIAELLPVQEYRARYWPEIAVIVVTPDEVDRLGAAGYAPASARSILMLDFHAEHDGAPYLVSEQIER